MNKYLDMLDTLCEAPGYRKYIGPDIPDMDIILSQALLMDAGSATFKAIKSGELAAIFAGLVALSYSALEQLAKIDQPVDESSVELSNDYLMIAITRKLSQKITNCASGDVKDYYALFRYCAHLATDFINADFYSAIRFYGEWRISLGNPPSDIAFGKLPDLTDYLFE